MSPAPAIRQWHEQKAMQAALRAARKLPEPIEAIFREVQRELNVTRSEIVGPRQFAPFVAARAAIAYRLRKRGCSLTMIGKYLGDRHHATVMNYLRAYKPESAVDWSIPDESGVWAI